MRTDIADSQGDAARRVMSLEAHTIYPIPHSERHGRTRDLFTVWFGCNLMMLTVATGALGTTVFGLPLLWAIGASTLGMVVGGVFMALHAAQGPRLGVPQMVQTRGQFGSWGAAPIVMMMVLMYVGFAASNCVLGGQSLQLAVPAISRDQGILLIVASTILPALLGYNAIHAAARLTTWFGGAAILYCLWRATALLPLSAWTAGQVTMTGLLGSVSTGALWQIAYAPYVSDASRYLRADQSGVRASFWASYGGSVLGSLLPTILGAELGLMAGHGDLAHTLGWVSGPFSLPVVVVMSFSIAIANAVNVYCGTLSTITVVQTFVSRWRAGLAARVVVTLGLTGLAAYLSLAMADNFLHSYTAFLELLMAVMVPWTAINLIDYYVVCHGSYDVDAFFARGGGIYGRWNVSALLSYAVGIACQIPFLSTPLYVGPIARRLAGADISWAVGLLVTTPVYLLAVRVLDRSRGAPTLASPISRASCTP
ncbi:purine-cytosine permease family protein [Ameyamaea chiangmaiensis]|nr:cytosine permease [Ameyamaea chiangmaiensis]